MNSLKLILIGGLMTIAFSTQASSPEFHPLISEGMVLQQKETIILNGKADPHTTLELSFSWRNDKITAVSGSDSLWSSTIQTPAASFDPHTITMSWDGGQKTIGDILFGEVWLCSGQSNMEMGMQGFTGQPVEGALEQIATSRKYKNLRMYTVPRTLSNTPLNDCGGKWVKPEPATAALFSAIGFMFGNMLAESLDIPIGIVVSAHGSSKIEAWIDRQTIEANGFTIFPTTMPERPHQYPTVLYNGMLSPLKNVKFRGVVWYQGESNKTNAREYEALLIDMISCWRKTFDSPALPFIVCQICPFPGNDELTGALVMEAQQKAVSKTDNAYIVGTSDLGSEAVIHPPKKKGIAERVLVSALANVYKEKRLPSEGPIFKSMQIRDGSILLSFENSGRGLFMTNNRSQNFEVASSDGVFHPAEATVKDREYIEVCSDYVPSPAYVRYAFKSWHQGDVYSTDWLPLYPFRTDNF